MPSGNRSGLSPIPSSRPARPTAGLPPSRSTSRVPPQVTTRAPGWVCFWSAEEVVESKRDYEVAEYLPGFFGFGSNGGGEILAFKVDGSEPWPIYMVPFIPMEKEAAHMSAKDFEEFRAAIGYELEGGE